MRSVAAALAPSVIARWVASAPYRSPGQRRLLLLQGVDRLGHVGYVRHSGLRSTGLGIQFWAEKHRGGGSRCLPGLSGRADVEHRNTIVS
eukprot:554151-Alexandrium_andersonii.AAC.1